MSAMPVTFVVIDLLENKFTIWGRRLRGFGRLYLSALQEERICDRQNSCENFGE